MSSCRFELAHLCGLHLVSLSVVNLQVLRYAASMESLALSLLPVFARALDLDENFFDAAFKTPMFRLRLSHYPPAPPHSDQYGIAPHTDTSFLTLLAQVVQLV